MTAEYGMLPRATHERTRREASAGKQSGRTQEIQRLVGRSLRAVVDLVALGERQITLDCDVLQADGGTRTAAITGSWVALFDCLKWMEQRAMFKTWPLKDHVAAISCGIHGYSQHAHLNLGKGFALKTDDRTGFPLCCARPGIEGCHVAYDNYRLVEGGREGHRAYGQEWGRITRHTILESGQWPQRLPLWSETA